MSKDREHWGSAVTAYCALVNERLDGWQCRYRYACTCGCHDTADPANCITGTHCGRKARGCHVHCRGC